MGTVTANNEGILFHFLSTIIHYVFIELSVESLREKRGAV